MKTTLLSLALAAGLRQMRKSKPAAAFSVFAEGDYQIKQLSFYKQNQLNGKKILSGRHDK